MYHFDSCILTTIDEDTENNQMLCKMHSRTYLYVGLFVKHFYRKCRRTTTGMFLESQSKTLPQNMG